MLRQSVPYRRRIALGVLSVVCAIMLYTLISDLQHRRNPDDTTIPTWRQIGGGIQTAIRANPRTGERWIVADAQATFTRLFLGLSAGVILAFVFGILMGCSVHTESFFIPWFTLGALIPPTAALAVYFVLVGTGLPMYITMIAVGTGATMGRSVYLAVKDVPSEMIFKAYTLGASSIEVVWNIIVRCIWPKFIDTLRLHIGPAMIFLIAAEMVVGSVGFGYRIRLQSRLLNMSVVYPYLALLGLFGYAVDRLLKAAQRKCCPWYSPEGSK